MTGSTIQAGYLSRHGESLGLDMHCVDFFMTNYSNTVVPRMTASGPDAAGAAGCCRKALHSCT